MPLCCAQNKQVQKQNKTKEKKTRRENRKHKNSLLVPSYVKIGIDPEKYFPVGNYRLEKG